MKACLLSGFVAAGLVAFSGASATAAESWTASIADPARAFAKGPVWSGNVTFVTVSPSCQSPTAFKVGDVRKAFFRPIPTGPYTPAAMIMFPDGVFLGVARSPSQYGAIAINKSVWPFASPTNTNKYSFVTKPPAPTTATQKVEIDATFSNYFYAVQGCSVRVKGTLQKS